MGMYESRKQFEKSRNRKAKRKSNESVKNGMEPKTGYKSHRSIWYSKRVRRQVKVILYIVKKRRQKASTKTRVGFYKLFANRRKSRYLSVDSG